MSDNGLIDGDSAIDLCILDEEQRARHGGGPPAPPGGGRGGCLGVLLLVTIPVGALVALWRIVSG
ncbi:MAG: hypothetical protein BWK76_06655 [Desulfobulbaceae bacterium A2]|nr:MAG: hypothetical protein BWK76_06655 [Desulfobulbaceae bacterium A2]